MTKKPHKPTFVKVLIFLAFLICVPTILFLILITVVGYQSAKRGQELQRERAQWAGLSTKDGVFKMQVPTSWTNPTYEFYTFPEGNFILLAEHPTADTQEGGISGLIVAKPFSIKGDLETYLNKEYAQDEVSQTTMTQETINGQMFTKVEVCGLGCYDFYFIQHEETVYGMVIVLADTVRDKPLMDKIVQSMKIEK